MSIPRILIIGSGAVGAVYGHYLAQAGCRPCFLVRNRDSRNSRMPRTLHHYSLLGRLTSQTQNLRVIDRASTGWDQVWLCLPSSSIEDPWLHQQLALLAPDTPLLIWTPDLRDRERLAAIHPGPISQALIGLISFQTPLPGESTPASGIAYLSPPRSAVLENSESGRQAAAWLSEGGLSTTVMDNLPLHEARMTALLQPVIAALEICNWSLKSLRASPLLATAGQAMTEARHIGERYLGHPPSRTFMNQRLLLKALLRLAPPLSPFPLETYLHYHFGKVGEQTRQMLDGWISQGEKLSSPSRALQQLRQALP